MSEMDLMDATFSLSLSLSVIEINTSVKNVLGIISVDNIIPTLTVMYNI